MTKIYKFLAFSLVILLGKNLSVSAQVYNFSYTGGAQTFIVPPGILNITVAAQGASGGLNSQPVSHMDSPGHGGCSQATFAVTPGQVINVYVGGHGANGITSVGGAGGFNGGGTGGGIVGSYGGGGGGGESDIRFGTTPMLIAAGGGGAGAECGGNHDKGGDGGTLTGQTGGASCTPPPITTGGGGGAGLVGGIGGTCGACLGIAGSAGTAYSFGAGVGGNGNGSPGGGGGGGYAGGGGGQYTGGGGGSSYIDPSGLSTSMSRGCNSGLDGTVSITAICTPGIVTASKTIFCAGSTSSVSDPVTGGTWSTGNTTIASVDSNTGIITGVSGGTAVITYNIGPCTAFTTVTVNPLPAPIIGPYTVCLGQVDCLSDTSAGGTWSISGTTIAVIGSGSGCVTGVGPGSLTVTYTLSTGCLTTTAVTVNPLPGVIIGASTVCVGSTTALSDAGGGTWSTSDITVVNIGPSSGIVTGLSGGTSMDTYTLPTGCYAVKTMTVNPLPSPIGGTFEICAGQTSALTDVGGGSWTSSNTAVANVGILSGFVTTTALTPGTSTITYTLSTGCTATLLFTVDTLPNPITGPTSICAGSTATYVETSGGGIWSESGLSGITSGGIASAGPPTVATVTYQNFTTGCEAFLTVTVNALPASITAPPFTVCQGQVNCLSDASTGGTWSTSNTLVIAVGGGSGCVTGVFPGTATVTYTLSTGCTATVTMTVNPLSPITGSASICLGGTSLLSDATAGGTWSTSATVVAVDVSGNVSGLSAGTGTISYTLASGCTATIVATVNPLAAITGNPNVCLGTPNSLSDPNPGGTWTSSNTLVATVGSSSGIVTGISSVVSGGLDIITYTLGSGCFATLSITVDPVPAAITGTFAVCSGLVTCLSDATPGGTWSSSNTVASVSAGTGCVTGNVPGTTTITYTLAGTGCIATASLVVNPLPGNINGTTSVCLGLNTNLSDASLGGAWSSSNTIVATVTGVGATGIVHGASVGTATITYTLPTGCINTTTVIVNPLPTAILGTFTICGGASTVLSDATGGGVWSSSNTSATITGLGTVNGNALGGLDTITYKLTATGCLVTETVLVNPLSPITGGDSVCNTAIITLSDITAGGTWSSSITTVAAIGTSSGVITTVSPGTSTICYTTSAGCKACIAFTVNPLPAVPVGSVNVCQTQTVTLSDATGGGIWSTASTTIIVTGAVITGVTAGPAVVTYTLPTGCSDTFEMVVRALGPIKGVFSVCPGDSVQLSDSVGIGTWSSSVTTTASVNASSGYVTGVATGGGTVIISFLTPDGCTATHTFTVNPTPGPIVGTTILCVGQSTKLTDGGAGTWSSSNSLVATITSGGTWSAVDSLHAIITYTLPTGCINFILVTVNPNPPPITGIKEICQGTTTLLSDATSGGVWSEVFSAIGTINPITGLYIGKTGGLDTVKYTFPVTGCTTRDTVRVDPISPILGVTSTCIGLTTGLSDAIGLGTWGTGATVASVNVSTGVVTGNAAGTATVTYTFTTGCTVMTTVTIFPLPDVITGNVPLCQGGTITLSDTISGGVWSSSATTIASIGTGGIVTGGTSGGTATITYTLGTGCYATVVVTVNPVTPIVSPPFSVCIGSTITLSDATTGGTWTSGNTDVALIDPFGGITTVGTVGGTSTITYATPGGCQAFQVVTVNPLPAPITGPTAVCVNSTITLNDISGTSTWSVLPAVTASIVPTTGVLTGKAAGTATVTFTLPTTCAVTYTVTVNPLPTPILGGDSVCVGGSITLSDATGPGTWSSSIIGVASIGSASGVLLSTGGSGTTVITYKLNTTGCSISEGFTVNAFPAGITGPNEVCASGAPITLHDASGPGSWTSSNTSFATVATAGFGTGTVTGKSGGIVTIDYTVTSTGCGVSYVVTVLPAPLALITPLGDTNICAGGFVTLTANTGFGLTYQWYTTPPLTPIPGAVSSSYIATPAVTTSYVVIVSSGITGCSATSSSMLVTVAPFTATITSTASTVCSGTSVTFTALPAGDNYQWQLMGVPIAGATAQTYTSTTPGDYTAVVSNGTGCSATSNIITVVTNPVPTGLVTFSGSLTICAGNGLVLTATDTALGYTYQWFKGVPAIGGATNESYTATTAGSYKVIVTNSFGCSATSASYAVTVNPLPVSPTITASGPETFCSGGNVSLLASSTTPGVTFQWLDNGVPIVGAVGALFLASTTGDYNAIITTALGCGATTDTDTVIVVNEPVLAPITSKSFCWGGSAELGVTVIGTKDVTYQWANGITPIPGATSDIYNATVSGFYTCQVSVIGTGGAVVCSIVSNDEKVTEFLLPNPIIDTEGSLLRTGNFFVSYTWYKDLVKIPGANSFTTPIIGNGDYKVGVTDTNGCQSVSDIYVLTGWSPTHGVGVQNVNAAGSIKIYPNPAQTMVHIESPEEVRAVISAMDGRMIIDQTKAKDIDITNLADGIYMITLYDDNGLAVKTEKLVKAAN